jgi:hypothetical protein
MQLAPLVEQARNAVYVLLELQLEDPTYLCISWLFSVLSLSTFFLSLKPEESLSLKKIFFFS